MKFEALSRPNQPLLGPDDPAPVVVTPGIDQNWLVVSDHASSVFPLCLGDLGLTDEQRYSHIGWDIGTPVVAKRIAERLQATLVECGYSRLVVDCNRYPQDPASVPVSSGGVPIPGNIGLTEEQRFDRQQSILLPYQNAIAAELNRLVGDGHKPVLLSIHSCAKEWKGETRPWQIGVSWSEDQRVARPLLRALKAHDDLVIGDNQPYTLDIGVDFTTPEHAIRRGLAHVQIEFRQDLIADDADALRWADVFVEALLACPADSTWHQVDPCTPQLLADISPLLSN